MALRYRGLEADSHRRGDAGTLRGRRGRERGDAGRGERCRCGFIRTMGVMGRRRAYPCCAPEGAPTGLGKGPWGDGYGCRGRFEGMA